MKIVNCHCERLLLRCRTLIRLCEQGRINADEFCYNFLITLVGESELCWQECVNLVPAAVAGDLYANARRLLEPVDFMPSPGVFLVRFPPLDDEVEAKKLELRPRYSCVFELIRKRAESCADSDSWGQD
jgi:hypothetical protein